MVDEIKAAGGKAAANYDSVENGEAIINTAIQNFGRVDILINNAGILRDISFKNMKDQDWDLINKVHTYGAYKVRLRILIIIISVHNSDRFDNSAQELPGLTSGNKNLVVF